MKISPKRLLISIAGFMLCTAFFLLMPGRGDAQTRPGAFISNEVAHVNGEVLYEPELLFTLLRMYGENTFYDLIEDEVIVRQANVMGVSLGDNDVVEYLSNAYSPEKLTALIDSFGNDVLDYAVGTQLLALKIVTKKIDQLVTEHNITVTDDEVQRFFIENLPRWTTPKSVRFSLIETATEAEANTARNRILAGEDFAAVCQEVSTHPGTRAYGGDIGGLVPEGYSTGERQILEDVAFLLEVGEISSPLYVEGNYYILTPTEKTEYTEPVLDDMSEYLHAGIVNQKVQPYLEDWMKSLMDDAESNIEITYPIYIENPPATFTPGASGSFIAPTIARVYDRNISESALLFHLLRQYGSATIESLIEEMLFVHQAVDMGVAVSDNEVRQSLAEVYDEQRLGILDDAFDEDVVTATLRQHLTALDVLGAKTQEIILENGIEITEEQIIQYYLDNLHQWTRPESVRFSMILVDTEQEAIAARSRITAGESFEAVCREVSTHEETSLYGGDIGASVPRGAASGENVLMLDTAFALAVGSVSQPLNIGPGWFLLKTTEKENAYEPTLTDMREYVINQLMEDRVAPFVLGWRSQLWTDADINVTYPIYSDNPSPDFTTGP